MATQNKKEPIEAERSQQRGLFFRLEDRVVFDASIPFLLDAVDDTVADDTSDPVDAHVASGQSDTEVHAAFDFSDAGVGVAPEAVEIAFVDEALPEFAQLVAGFGPDVEVFTVASDVNGFEFMAEVLGTRSDVSALHVMGHGEAGQVYLGNSVLSEMTLGLASEALRDIGASLTEGGDILLYGCDVAGDPAAEDFIRQIAQLTAADIAASDDATGASDQGGDWELEFATGEIEAEALDVPEWDNIMHTNSVGFLLTPGSVSGTYNVEAFFGSWHSGGIAALGRAVLYSIDTPGADPTDPANFNTIAYGDNDDLSGGNEYVFSRSTSVTTDLGYENGSHAYTKAEIDAAGFTTGANYFWADRSGNLIDTNVGAYLSTYNHQSAVIPNVAPGTYRLDYELPKPTDATWRPVSGVDKVIFSIDANGTLRVAGASSPVALAGYEDVATQLSHADFANSFSTPANLGDVKITQLPTNGQILVDGSAISAGDTISKADLDANKVTYVANAADWSGSDTFKWAGYDTAATDWSDAADGGITIAPVNDAPSLDLLTAASPTFTEGTDTNGVAVFSDATLSTYEAGQTITSITIEVGNIADGSDERLIVDGSEFALLHNETGTAPNFSYSVSNSGNVSVVTLSGLNMTTSRAETLIKEIKYNNTSIDPTTSGGRTFMVTQVVDSGGTASDGRGVDTANYDAAAYAGNGSINVSTVTITAVNNDPTISALSAATTYYENTNSSQNYGSVSVFRDAVVSGGEPSDTIKSMTLTVSNVEATDHLMIEGDDFPLTAGGPFTIISGNVDVTITVDSGTATIVLNEKSSGSLTSAEAGDLLNGLKFFSTSEDPSSTSRVVSVTTVEDSQGGTVSPSINSTIAVVPVNDAPVVNVPADDYVTTKSSSNPGGDFKLGGLRVEDADDNIVTVVLSLSKDADTPPASYGTLTFDAAAITTFQAASGTITDNGSDGVTLSGTKGAINALLAEGGGPTYSAETGQDVVDDGPNTLTISTDDGTTTTTVTKDITVLPAPPNSQSLVAIGTEDTTLIAIPNLASKITIAGSSVLSSSGYYTFGSSGTVDDSVEFTGDGSQTTFTTFVGHDETDIEVWVTDTSAPSPTAVLLVRGPSDDYTLDTGAGQITFNVAPTADMDILVKSTDGSLTNGATVTDTDTGATGLDLGNGHLYKAEGDIFTGASASFTNSNTALNGMTADHLSAVIVDASGVSTALTIVADTPANANEIKYDGTDTWTLSSALAAGSTVYINSDQPTGDLTTSEQNLNGSLVFIPNADFYGTDTFYYQYNSPRTTLASGDGSTTVYSVPVSDGSVEGAVVKVNGITQERGIDYSVNPATNSVSFLMAPPSPGTNNIEILTTVMSPVSQGLIYISGVNDAPAAAVPSPYLELVEDATNQSISLGTTAFSDLANEIGGGTYEARLNVTNGTLNFTATDGDGSGASDVFVADGAVGSSYLVLRGTADDLKATLNTLTFTPNSDYFTPAQVALGDGSTTDFAIGSDVTQAADVHVYVNKVLQASGFSVDTTNDKVVFTSPPAAGDNIEIVLDSATDTLTYTINDMGNTGSGGALTDTKTLKLVVRNVNDQPTITADALNATFTEQGLPAFIFDNTYIDLGEADDRVESFTFTISNLRDGGAERIILDSTNAVLSNTTGQVSSGPLGVTYSIALTSTDASATATTNDVATITVSKPGGLSVAEAQTLIDEIRYLNTSSNPDTTVSRSVTITQLVDTGGTAVTGVDSANNPPNMSSGTGIQGINSAPKISAITTGMTVMHYEDTAADGIFSNTSIDTIEAGQDIIALTLTVENVVDLGHEFLTIGGEEISLTSASTTTIGTGTSAFDVQVACQTLDAGTPFERITATVSVTGLGDAEAGDAVEAQTLINDLKYRNSSQAPKNENNRIVTITLLQDDGGLASGGQDTSTSPNIYYDGGVVSRQIMVMGVNDAPIDIGSLDDQTMVTGDVYHVEAAPVFNDPEGDGIVYTATGLPRGVTINPATGVISGRPLTAGIFNITVTATDSLGASNSVTYTDTISSPNRAGPPARPMPEPHRDAGPIFEPDVTNETAQNTLSGGSDTMRRAAVDTPDQRHVHNESVSPTLGVMANYSLPSGTLMVGRPLPDTLFTPGEVNSLLVPSDTFISTGAVGQIGLTLTATLADGSELPDWIVFDPERRTFEATPPEEFEGAVEVLVRAVDAAGNQASTMATIFVGDEQTSDDGAWLENEGGMQNEHAQVDWESLGREFENASRSTSNPGILALSQQLA